MHKAKATTIGSLSDITIQHEDGTVTKLGRPNTLGFKLRRSLYVRKLKRKGLL